MDVHTFNIQEEWNTLLDTHAGLDGMGNVFEGIKSEGYLADKSKILGGCMTWPTSL